MLHELMKSVVFPVKKTVEFLESIATGYLAAARNQLSPGFCRVESHHNVLSKYLGSCLWESYQNFTRRQGHQAVCGDAWKFN